MGAAGPGRLLRPRQTRCRPADSTSSPVRWPDLPAPRGAEVRSITILRIRLSFCANTLLDCRRTTGMKSSSPANKIRTASQGVIYPSPGLPDRWDRETATAATVFGGDQRRGGMCAPGARRIWLGCTKLACQVPFVISFSTLVASGKRAVVQCCTKAPPPPGRLTLSSTVAVPFSSAAACARKKVGGNGAQ